MMFVLEEIYWGILTFSLFGWLIVFLEIESKAVLFVFFVS